MVLVIGDSAHEFCTAMCVRGVSWSDVYVDNVPPKRKLDHVIFISRGGAKPPAWAAAHPKLTVIRHDYTIGALERAAEEWRDKNLVLTPDDVALITSTRAYREKQKRQRATEIRRAIEEHQHAIRK